MLIPSIWYGETVDKPKLKNIPRIIDQNLKNVKVMKKQGKAEELAQVRKT